MKKILIIYTSAGNGHLTAACSLEEAFLELYKEKVNLKLVDALDYTHLAFKEVYSKSYFAMANYTPHLWGILYDKTDKKTQTGISKKIVTTFDKLNAIKLSGLVKEFNPDHIVSTHFFPAEVLASKSKKDQIPHSVIVTDYEMHEFWIRKGVSQYFVASNGAKYDLHYRSNFPLKDIHDYGIPIPLKFIKKGNRAKFLNDLGLSSKKKTLLVLSGGLGIGDTSNYVDAIASLDIPVNIICVAGKNNNLKNKLESRKYGTDISKTVTGYVNNMNDYINASDIVITKPGGLTVSECLALNTPMILILPIPGQEDANSDYLTEKGVALKAKNEYVFRYKLKTLLTDKNKLNKMIKSCKAISEPKAALRVAKKIYEY